VAQIVVQRVERAEFVEVGELPVSERGAGGHGSTGGATVLADRPLEVRTAQGGRN
jgi:dUTP pyrophosphatase